MLLMWRFFSKTDQPPPRTRTSPDPPRRVLTHLCAAFLSAYLSTTYAATQTTADASRRLHLILRDGSFQLVTDYRVAGGNVVYHSAERAGAEEIIPLALVDLDATHRWEQRHGNALPAPGPDGQQPAPPPIDPELLREEAARAALTPEVTHDLRLPEQDSFLALDTFHGAPELVPLAQSEAETGSRLNRFTAHNVLAGLVNPMSSPHPVVTLRGPRSAVQLHVAEPVFYVRIGDDTDVPASGTAFTVDTHGSTANAAAPSAGGSAGSRYVIVRADVRIDIRQLASFSLTSPADGRPLPDEVTPVHADALPGGHWLRLVPARPLDFGEFALLEILDDRRINLGVWDFGVHPAAPENRDVIRPDPRHRPALNRGDNRPDEPLSTH